MQFFSLTRLLWPSPCTAYWTEGCPGCGVPKWLLLFAAVKHLLVSNSILTQYCENLPLVLACDASLYGVGDVLSHRFPNGLEAPVVVFSRILVQAERNYSQLDKEALALVAGVRRFHDYLYG